MEKKLNLNEIPKFVTCIWHGNDLPSPIRTEGRDDALLLCFEGFVKYDNDISLAAGEYRIAVADGIQREIEFGENSGVICFFFNGDYNESDSSIPLEGIFDTKATSYYVNRMREIYEKKLDGQRVSFIEQQALLCHVLACLEVRYILPNSTCLAKSIMQEIVEHYTEDITLDYLSDKFYYSKNYIVSSFKKEYNTTPYSHLRNLRVAGAMELIKSTDKTLESIAEQVGFHDSTTFFRAFKNVTGMSPTYWKKENRKTSDKPIDV